MQEENCREAESMGQRGSTKEVVLVSVWEARSGSSKEVMLKLGFEARGGECLVFIRENSLLVDRELLERLIFLATQAADGKNSCLLTSQSGSLQSFLFLRVPVYK